MKKVLCLLLSFLMIVSLATSISAGIVINKNPYSTYDEASLDNAIPEGYSKSGKCGDDAYWAYYEDSKTLVIGGEGRVSTGAYSTQHEYAELPFEKAVVLEGITELMDNAFTRCSSLKEVTLPDSLKKIYNYTFFECKNLKSVTIPKNVELIGIGLFYRCDALEELRVDEDNPVFDSRDNCNAIIHTETNSLRVGIRTTTFPESVTAIGGAAFAGVSGLTQVVIPDTVTEIYGRVFTECKDLKRVFLSSNAKTVVENMFDRCDNLEYVLIPEGVETISVYAFAGCTKLDNVTIPKSVKNIYQSAFSGCTSLKSIAINDGVELLGPMAFSGCTSLEIVSLPASVKKIQPHAFANCTALKAVIINNAQCEIDDRDMTFPESAVIYGHKDSTAQAYAKKYSRTFKPLNEAPQPPKPEVYEKPFVPSGPTGVIGDVDFDGVMSVMDATEIQMVLAQIKNWKYNGCDTQADVDNDNTVSVMDATEIQLILAGLR
ncbi:MAG: leucine-rich repeat protein [Ruminococcus sp.]|nr:leucine-rich repeat protein [Ruminococcus sp.]